MGRLPQVKGGVWRNTEDEILKAAVMKYGKNQWARIASLLSRKSPKQCKERWYSWLDPSVKKTEWSRDEEEALLHLAKIYPTQWQTIAPLVGKGRTAAMCLQKYDQLLSQALGKSEEEVKEAKRLRPGEVDMNAVHKPARPDPVDMDEDEKEMLSEARARMANTVGKKAKRKAREKQMIEARRLAGLQRKRELKAAGIEPKVKAKRKKEMDYNSEIPFHKKEPKGFHSTTDEKHKEKNFEFVKKKKTEYTGKTRDDRDKEEQKKANLKRKEQDKDEYANLAKAAIEEKKRQQRRIAKRSKLVLPGPQVSESDLQDIVKFGQVSERARGFVDDEEEEGSNDLLSDYSVTPSQASRTPMMKEEDDRLVQDARLLAAMTDQTTPLLAGREGGNFTPINMDHYGNSGGNDNAKSVIQTPNTVLKTPMSHSQADGTRFGTTPAPGTRGQKHTGKSFATPTPRRDMLGINAMDDGDIAFDPSTAGGTSVIGALLNLPKPKNDFEIVAPDVEEGDGSAVSVAEPRRRDAEEIRIEQEQEAQRLRELELERRSQTLKRNFPRPILVNQAVVNKKSGDKEESSLQEADRVIKKEMVMLMLYEAHQYPHTESKAPVASEVVYNNDIGKIYLEQAHHLLVDEMKTVQQGMGHVDLRMEEYGRIWDSCMKEICYSVNQHRYARASVLNNKEKLEAKEKFFTYSQKLLAKEGFKKADKLEKTSEKLCHGYMKKSVGLREEISEIGERIAKDATDLKCYQALRLGEMVAIRARVEALEEEVGVQRKREQDNQIKYQQLQDHYTSLIAKK